MKYVKINENNEVMEIIPEYVDLFPGRPIQDRYPEFFIATLLTVADEMPVEQLWIFDPKLGHFAPPQPQIPPEVRPAKLIQESLDELTAANQVLSAENVTLKNQLATTQEAIDFLISQ